MSSNISILIQMQNIDDNIAELEVLKVKKPKQLDYLKTEVAKAEHSVKAIEKNIEANTLATKTKESEVKANTDQARKYGHQLDGIKNNKEYKALNNQIVQLNEKNKNIENDIITLMEEAEELKAQLGEATKLKKKADANLLADEDILKKEIAKIDVDITKLKEKRTEYAKLLPVPIVKKYIQLIKNKNNKAIVFCNPNNACSGCGFHIRPQILIELNTPDKIIYCENCGRILVRSLEE